VGRPSWEREAEDKSSGGGRPVTAENEESARRECHTSDRQTSDQRGEPVERGRAAPAHPDDDRRDGVTGVDRIRDGAAIGSRKAVTAIVRSRRGSRGVQVGGVREETAVGSLGRTVCCHPDACADERNEHAENERNPQHVELLLFRPLGASDQNHRRMRSPQRRKSRLQGGCSDGPNPCK